MHTTPATLAAAQETNGERLVGATFAMSGRWSRATATPRSFTASTSASTPARSPRCSVPMARASRPCARWQPGSWRRRSGTVSLEGRDITGEQSFRRARDGVLLVPEARGIFPGLTVEENLTVILRDPEDRARTRTRGSRFWRERRKQVAGLLSGGEQQMLSLAPALANPPKVLIADEPTLGLAPLAADAVMQAIIELRDAGSAILLVEEHAQNALMAADTVAFMELGAIVWVGLREDADMELLTSAYLGTRG